MERYKTRIQKNRSGKLISPLVDTKAKVSTLETIRAKFKSPFTMDEFLDKKLSSYDRNKKNKIAKQTMRIKRLVVNGWLKKLNKEKKFEVTKKYKNYKKNWGSFDNISSPLMRVKEPQIITEIKEIEIEKEITKLDKTKYLGEI